MNGDSAGFKTGTYTQQTRINLARSSGNFLIRRAPRTPVRGQRRVRKMHCSPARGREAPSGASLFGLGIGSAPWACQSLKLLEPQHCVFARVAAHLCARLQPAAHRWPFRLPEQLAAQVWREVRATLPGPLAVGHFRHGRGDGRGDATSTAPRPAFGCLVGCQFQFH